MENYKFINSYIIKLKKWNKAINSFKKKLK